MYLDFAAIVVAVGAVFAALAWLADRKLDAPVDQPARPDRHLPADEYRLLGDDWTERITEFRSEQFIRATRRRFAVMAVTGADPEKTEAADVTVPASRTKEIDSLASYK